jgi:tRNA/tmRNA/rRNA uracil-C5-methylase (TrmA/RlmC/RlmD family)
VNDRRRRPTRQAAPEHRASRRARSRQPRGRSRVGERFEAVVGPVAHGGHFVVRVPAAAPGAADSPDSLDTSGPTRDDMRVVFVRHALPGERVVVEITEGTDGDRFWRGDAVEVVEAAAERVPPPCPYAGPGKCGGCDFQHVAVPAQRSLKAAVLREQLTRLARLAPGDPVLDTPVEQVPGDDDGLRWRTRQSFARTADGSRAMRLHRSHEVIPVEDCLIARTDAREPASGTVTETVTAAGVTKDFTVAADGFWQVHPGAPTTLVETVLTMLEPRPGERVLDLYAGVGLFAAFLADRVGPQGHVLAVEGDPRASGLSRGNVPQAEVVAGDVAQVLATAEPSPVDLVVLDPPREGARRAVVEQVAARSPRAVAYVACDPAALARDTAIFAEHGYRLDALRAFDLFPMTHHFECVALLVPQE